MEDGFDIDHPLREALEDSHFAATETIADIARTRTTGDLYLALARTIEREVVPRLLFNTRLEVARRNAARSRALNRKSRDVATFCEIILKSDLDDAQAYVAREIAEGAEEESILLDLFAPTARRLGELWETDESSFIEVTFALGKLQQLLRIFSATYQSTPAPTKMGFRALLATVPNNQHIFGILVVEEFFRRSGWNVLTLPSPLRSELLQAVAQEWFGVVGLSISCDESAKSVPSLIAELRATSLNKSMLVLVGGRYIEDNPEQSMLMGADLAGEDAQEAIDRSRDFLQSIGR